jgi:ankyrin repeat protein
MLACTKDHLEAIAFLVNHGADLKIRNKDGWTALHIAVREAHLNVVRYLLQFSDEKLLTSKTKNGRTVLHIAGKTFLF